MSDPLENELRDTLGDPGAHELRTLLRQTDAGWRAPAAAARRPGWPRYLAAAAAILLLIVAGWWTTTQFRSASPESLFASYYTPYETFAAERGDTPGTLLFAQANAAYRAGNYALAYEGFTTLLDSEPDNTLYRFLLAQAALAAGRAAEAAADFEQLVSTPDHLFTEQSRWYVALAYLKQGKLPDARRSFEAIAVGQYRHAEAQAILRQLAEE